MLLKNLIQMLTKLSKKDKISEYAAQRGISMPV